MEPKAKRDQEAQARGATGEKLHHAC